MVCDSGSVFFLLLFCPFCSRRFNSHRLCVCVPVYVMPGCNFNEFFFYDRIKAPSSRSCCWRYCCCCCLPLSSTSFAFLFSFCFLHFVLCYSLIVHALFPSILLEYYIFRRRHFFSSRVSMSIVVCRVPSIFPEFFRVYIFPAAFIIFLSFLSFIYGVLIRRMILSSQLYEHKMKGKNTHTHGTLNSAHKNDCKWLWLNWEKCRNKRRTFTYPV